MEKNQGIRVSFCSFELYNEKAFDLLQSRKPVTIKKIGNEVSLTGLSFHELSSSIEFEQTLASVLQNRSLGETTYNLNSSRSHTFFQFHIQHYAKQEVGYSMCI